jgi:hypothetical protein
MRAIVNEQNLVRVIEDMREAEICSWDRAGAAAGRVAFELLASAGSTSAEQRLLNLIGWER